MINSQTYNNIDNTNPSKKHRIWEIDALRGFCILLMILDHFFITLTFVYGIKWFGHQLTGTSFLAKLCRFGLWYYNSLPRTVIHPIIAFLFIWICGISCGFSKSNFKRGIQLFIIAIAVTLLTYIFDKQGSLVLFGILHFLAFCIIVWSIIQLFSKNNKIAQIIIGLSMSLIVGIIYIVLVNNQNLNTAVANKFFILTESTISSKKSPGDFFALIPWSALFFLGAGLTFLIYPNKKSLLPNLDGKWNKPLCFCGRHTLFIYCIHQIVFILIFEFISFFSITKGQFVYLIFI